LLSIVDQTAKKEKMNDKDENNENENNKSNNQRSSSISSSHSLDGLDFSHVLSHNLTSPRNEVQVSFYSIRHGAWKLILYPENSDTYSYEEFASSDSYFTNATWFDHIVEWIDINIPFIFPKDSSFSVSWRREALNSIRYGIMGRIAPLIKGVPCPDLTHSEDGPDKPATCALFNIELDPREQYNVASQEPEALKKIFARLREVQENMPPLTSWLLGDRYATPVKVDTNHPEKKFFYPWVENDEEMKNREMIDMWELNKKGLYNAALRFLGIIFGILLMGIIFCCHRRRPPLRG